MNVTALAAHTPEAVRAALAARGWESQPAWFAAMGIERQHTNSAEPCA